MSERVPDLEVEKLALGVLSEAEAEAVRARLGDEADERLGAIERSNREILDDHPPGEIAAAVRRRLEAKQKDAARSSRGWWLALPTLAAAAGVLLWIGTRGPEEVASETSGSAEDSNSEVIILKGDARLVIQRRRGATDQQLVDGDTVRAGDLLQVSYHAGSDAQGVIVSLDGRGVVTLHHPVAPTGETTLSTGGAIPLPEAYELDDAPTYERFFFVTGEDVDVQTVTKALVTLSKSESPGTAPLDLPPTWQQSSVLLKKE